MLDFPLTMLGKTATSSPYVNFHDKIIFTASGSGGSDIKIDSNSLLTSIENRFTFDLLNDISGSAPVSGLLLSQLSPGAYFSRDKCHRHGRFWWFHNEDCGSQRPGAAIDRDNHLQWHGILCLELPPSKETAAVTPRSGHCFNHLQQL